MTCLLKEKSINQGKWYQSLAIKIKKKTIFHKTRRLSFVVMREGGLRKRGGGGGEEHLWEAEEGTQGLLQRGLWQSYFPEVTGGKCDRRGGVEVDMRRAERGLRVETVRCSVLISQTIMWIGLNSAARGRIRHLADLLLFLHPKMYWGGGWDFGGYVVCSRRPVSLPAWSKMEVDMIIQRKCCPSFVRVVQWVTTVMFIAFVSASSFD